MIYNNITFQRLSYLKYHLDDEFDSLPHTNGIYYWIYWPEFDPLTVDPKDLVIKLNEFTNRKLAYSEPFKGKYKFSGELSEQWYLDNGNLFGLPLKKHNILIKHLSDRNNIYGFAELFKELCFYRPFYLGKANNLKSRLSDHFDYKTGVLTQIDNSKIDHTEIWVGYKLIEDSAKVGLNVIFEEIFSRAFKPGLTKKPN